MMRLLKESPLLVSVIPLVLLLAMHPLFGATIQEPEEEEEQVESSDEAKKPEEDEKPKPKEKPKIKPYDEVITSDAKSDEGVFLVHRVKEKLYYEIPEKELSRDFLWVSRIARTVTGVGYGGQKLGTRVVRWERQGDRVLLRNVEFSMFSDPEKPISLAVDSANNNTIIMAFEIQAVSEVGSPVVEVGPLFETEVTEFSARQRLQARGFDKKRSFLDSVLSFPENIEVRTNHTYTKPPAPPNNTQRTPPASLFGRGMDPGSATVLLHYSMVKLPENPMMPRLYDPRVGYFSVRQTDFGRDEHKSVERRFITRWRLEKQHPEENVSEPAKPIVYWIDPATPEKWRPFIRRGVEKWQKAFEAAGFKNAIIAKQGPTPEEDPEWHPEDARYSVIRWFPSQVENAMGPHVHDPRTGEILESDIYFYHNVQNLLRSWYFLQVGPLDPRAQKLPLPDDLMGDLIEYVAAHEVGHTLGFQHNMKASSLYPFEKIRDPEWLKEMGHTPTMMDYSRFNYVAQPEDGIDPKDFIPGIGPYDVWATMWGYKPIPEAATPDEELETLGAWARQQDETPWYRFSTAGSKGSDPGELTEAVGDENAVEATRLGVKNLERVSAMLLTATSEEGKAWDDLELMYGRMLGQWVREMNHVVALIGGFYSWQRHAGQEGVRFEIVPKERQQEAVAFLLDNAFQTPEFMVRPEILRRIEPNGVLSRVRNSQRAVLNSMLNPARFERLVEQHTIDGEESYSPDEYLSDLRNGLWAELLAPSVAIDAFRRNVQRTYLTLVDARLNGRTPVSNDMRAFLRGELRRIDEEIAGIISRAADDMTRYHLEDVRAEISDILDPAFPRSVRSTNRNDSQGFNKEGDADSQTCWPDLVIRP